MVVFGGCFFRAVCFVKVVFLKVVFLTSLLVVGVLSKISIFSLLFSLFKRIFQNLKTIWGVMQKNLHSQLSFKSQLSLKDQPIWQKFCIPLVSFVFLVLPSSLHAHSNIIPHSHAGSAFWENLLLFLLLLVSISVFSLYLLKKSSPVKKVDPSCK